MRDVCVNADGLIFRRGRIRSASFVAPMYAEYVNSVRGYARFFARNYLLRSTVRAPHGLWVVDNFSVDNYHHWMVDCLTRVLDGERLYPAEDVLLLPRDYARHGYVHFSLQAFPQIKRVGWIGSRAKVRVAKLGFVPHPARSARRPVVYERRPIAEVAHRIRDLVGVGSSGRRIYFTREDAARRRARNERDVVRVLRSFDVDIVRIDPARPWDQMRAASESQLVVGVHGAALTNVMFMPRGGQLIELRRVEQGDIFFFDHYRAMAATLGLTYVAQLCEPADRPDGYELNDADLIVDLDELRENLRAAG